MMLKPYKVETRLSERDYYLIEKYAEKWRVSKSAIVRMCCNAVLGAEEAAERQQQENLEEIEENNEELGQEFGLFE